MVNEPSVFEPLKFYCSKVKSDGAALQNDKDLHFSNVKFSDKTTYMLCLSYLTKRLQSCCINRTANDKTILHIQVPRSGCKHYILVINLSVRRRRKRGGGGGGGGGAGGSRVGGRLPQ